MKEMGQVSFTDEEKVAVAKMFGFSIGQVNQIFFNGEFPTGNNNGPEGNQKTSLLP